MRESLESIIWNHRILKNQNEIKCGISNLNYLPLATNKTLIGRNLIPVNLNKLNPSQSQSLRLWQCHGSGKNVQHVKCVVKIKQLGTAGKVWLQSFRQPDVDYLLRVWLALWRAFSSPSLMHYQWLMQHTLYALHTRISWILLRWSCPAETWTSWMGSRVTTLKKSNCSRLD